MSSNTAETGTPRKRKVDGAGSLHDLLLTKFPKYRSVQGLFDTLKFARDTGSSHETIYKMFRGNRITTTRRALLLLRYSREQNPANPLTWQELAPFVLPEFEEYSDPLSI